MCHGIRVIEVRGPAQHVHFGTIAREQAGLGAVRVERADVHRDRVLGIFFVKDFCEHVDGVIGDRIRVVLVGDIALDDPQQERRVILQIADLAADVPDRSGHGRGIRVRHGTFLPEGNRHGRHQSRLRGFLEDGFRGGRILGEHAIAAGVAEFIEPLAAVHALDGEGGAVAQQAEARTGHLDRGSRHGVRLRGRGIFSVRAQSGERGNDQCNGESLHGRLSQFAHPLLLYAAEPRSPRTFLGTFPQTRAVHTEQLV
ncbi:MAG: hypothetical protein BWY59_00801 [Verrucomicrobia bacterium ADurb.Bin345]|nr:MAG: hypothetical protein BWY59_00801 [Verrucomicrobia bacterium ADurb.Bin345]